MGAYTSSVAAISNIAAMNLRLRKIRITTVGGDNKDVILLIALRYAEEADHLYLIEQRACDNSIIFRCAPNPHLGKP